MMMTVSMKVYDYVVAITRVMMVSVMVTMMVSMLVVATMVTIIMTIDGSDHPNGGDGQR